MWDLCSETKALIKMTKLNTKCITTSCRKENNSMLGENIQGGFKWSKGSKEELPEKVTFMFDLYDN